MKSTLQQTKVIALGVILAAGLSYALAWTGPSSTPPNGNVAAPINVSSSTQTKYGNLVLNGLSVSAATILSGVLQIPIGTPAANNVLVSTDASGTVAWVSTSTLGFGGSSNSSGFTHMQDFDSSGTWTAPTGVTQVMVEAWGGGAGSAGNGTTIMNGGAGGYGKGIVSVSPGSSYTVTVGSGGSGSYELGTNAQCLDSTQTIGGVTYYPAGGGGTSSFGNLISATGASSISCNNNTGSVGGSSVASINITGQSGGVNTAGDDYLSGGNTGNGGSGGVCFSSSASCNGNVPGGGAGIYAVGTGGGSQSARSTNTGNGAHGRVVVYW